MQKDKSNRNTLATDAHTNLDTSLLVQLPSIVNVVVNLELTSP